MRGDAGPIALHATAVAIDGRCVLIRGPSRSGKSRLAVALIAASTRSRRIRLVGDDRILLTAIPAGILVRPHPRIAGFIERRGLGLVAMPYVAASPLAAVVELRGPTTLPWLDQQNFPVLSLVKDAQARDRADQVLRWWPFEDRVLRTTPPAESPLAR